MTQKKTNQVWSVTKDVLKRYPSLSLAACLMTVLDIIASLIPPLFLADVIDALASGKTPGMSLFIAYPLSLLAASMVSSVKEVMLVKTGQKITHGMRSALSAKLNTLSAEDLSGRAGGEIVSRFIGDVDMVEELFTDGIISMISDLFKIISILIIVFTRNKGLALILLVILPFTAMFTRHVQKKTLEAELAGRGAAAAQSAVIPETIRDIRSIRFLHSEAYMEKRYGKYLEDGLKAQDRINFYDSIYSPVILILNAVTVAAVYILAASGNPAVLTLFGMSAGTSVAVINYISQIFTPLESLGMEIQTIQSAAAGLRRISAFLAQPERTPGDLSVTEEAEPLIVFDNVSFAYNESHTVLSHFNEQIRSQERVTLKGRTGIGKSTLFKLMLGLYAPDEGRVLIAGTPAERIRDEDKRSLFGIVEQEFHPVHGTVRDQITLGDTSLSEDEVRKALADVGLQETVLSLPQGLDTQYDPALFSHGQLQLLAIARAVVSNPKILLLDEITADLDAATEKTVLDALNSASASRTVIMISHRDSADQGRIITL